MTIQQEWQHLIKMSQSEPALTSLYFWYQQWQQETDASKKKQIEKQLASCARKTAGKASLFKTLQSIAPQLARCFSGLRHVHEKTRAREQ